MLPLITVVLAFMANSTLAAPPTKPLPYSPSLGSQFQENQERSICTGLHVGKFGWCGGCKRLETCSAYLAFLSGCTATELRTYQCLAPSP